ncbi:hypothetical protein B296_00054807 [Ensete ventricosum]|uniref:Uncharacterized protein n=1 Tax=Ensete ventricosum TaxID=4639 RepID=A0A426XF35_ENSVE|nr:hypothetical protein B296_00054807 [Ensete ventricosum]
MMRLNRVESFYTLLLHFRSEGSKEEGRPATASPHVGLATHGRAAANAPARGRPTATRAGMGARNGLLHAASPAASKGSASSRRGGRPLVAPTAVAYGLQKAARVAAACVGATATAAQMGQEGLGHPFEKE